MFKSIVKISFLLFLLLSAMCVTAMISPDEAISFFINSGYDFDAFRAREKEINDAMTKQEAQIRYSKVVSMSEDEIIRALGNSCLANSLYENVHYFLTDDGEMLPILDRLYEDDYDIDSGWIINFVEDKEELSKNYKRVYAFPNTLVKKNVFKNTGLTDLWLGPNCVLDVASVVENKNLKYIKIDPNVEDIDEDAFQDNPNIEVFHVCCENYDSQNRHNKISYHIKKVPGEVPPIAFYWDDNYNRLDRFLKTIYRDGKIRFFDTKYQRYVEDNRHTNSGVQITANKTDLSSKHYDTELDYNVIGGAYRDSYYYNDGTDYDRVTLSVKYIDIDGILFKKDESDIQKNGVTLMFYPVAKKDESYEIPEGVEKIGNSAFRNAKNLKFVTIPKSVTEIGRNSFLGTKLTIKGKRGSYAEKYAKSKKIKFEQIKEVKH